MTASIIIWLCVAVFLVVVILMRVADDKRERVTRQSGNTNNRNRFKFIEIGKEREEFFIAGDPISRSTQEDYDIIDNISE